MRGLEPCGMIIDRPPPPAAKDCKICIFSTQIIPLILGNDLESMATEPMHVSYVKYKDQSSWEMKSGKEGGKKNEGARREQMSVEEKSAHLDAFVITTVSFLWVQIYKTDLRVKKKRASGWRDFTVILKFLHCLSISYITEAVCSVHHIVILTEAFLRRCSCLRGAGRSRCKPEMIFFPHVSPLLLFLFSCLHAFTACLSQSPSFIPCRSGVPSALTAGLMVCDGVLMSVLGPRDCPIAAVWFCSTQPLL